MSHEPHRKSVRAALAVNPALSSDAEPLVVGRLCTQAFINEMLKATPFHDLILAISDVVLLEVTKRDGIEGVRAFFDFIRDKVEERTRM